MRAEAKLKRILIQEQRLDRVLFGWKRRVLRRTGAYGRTVLKRSMPRSSRQKTARPGRPPRAHIRGDGGLRFVLFDAQPELNRVRIGIARSPKRAIRSFKDRTVLITSRKPPPKLLNESGSAQYTTTWKHSGQVTVESVLYHQFPISKHKPTVKTINDKFVEFVITTPVRGGR